MAVLCRNASAPCSTQFSKRTYVCLYSVIAFVCASAFACSTFLILPPSLPHRTQNTRHPSSNYIVLAQHVALIIPITRPLPLSFSILISSITSIFSHSHSHLHSHLHTQISRTHAFTSNSLLQSLVTRANTRRVEGGS